jgi:hypothetical protein
MMRSTLAFLGCPSRDFGIVYALALAGRTRLTVRSPFGQRHRVHRTYSRGAGILTCRPSTTPFGLALGSD